MKRLTPSPQILTWPEHTSSGKRAIVAGVTAGEECLSPSLTGEVMRPQAGG